MKRISLSRRRFLSVAAGSSALAILGPSLDRVLAETPAPSRRTDLKLGLIGLGRHGAYLARRFAQVAEVAALCDVHRDRLEQAGQPPGVKSARNFTDHRDLLAMKELDGVVVATPDHWHALMTIEALAAGKHVYLETPACRTLAEGRALLRAAERYGRMIQVGNCGRANAAVAAVARAVRAGRLGKVMTCQCWSNPAPIPEPEKPSDSPPELDWDRWLGPALERPYRPSLFAGGWRWEPDLGGGYYRERLSTHLALLPWIADLKLNGHWTVRPAGDRPEDGLGEPQALTFDRQDGGGSILWQLMAEKRHPLGWGMDLIGEKDSIWLAGGDAHCAAEAKVFSRELSRRALARFNPDHRGDWLTAIETGRPPTMSLRDSVAAVALIRAGEYAWKAGREVQVNLTTLELETEEATEPTADDYRAPWKLPD